MNEGNAFVKKLDSYLASFLLLLIGFCFFVLKEGACLHINDLVVPDVVKNGTTSAVVLDCDYSLDSSDVGLVVKWFLNDGDTPVYQWIPPQRPQDLGKLKTLASSFAPLFPSDAGGMTLDSFFSQPQWGSIPNFDLSTKCSPSCQDFYDSFQNCQESDSLLRTSSALSLFYPSSLQPPPISTWKQCPIPQILTLDNSILAKPLDYSCQKLPVFIQMLELPKEGADAASVGIAAKSVVPAFSEVTKPVIEVIKSAAYNSEMLSKPIKTNFETVSTTMKSAMLASTSETIPEAVTEMANNVALEAVDAPPTPPPEIEKEAEMINMADPATAAADAPEKMNMLTNSIPANKVESSDVNRCFLQTISQPNLNYYTYELQLPH